MSQTLYLTLSGGAYPTFSPSGRYVLAGNGVLKLIDVAARAETRIAASLPGFLRGGWFSDDEILLQHDGERGDGFLYRYRVSDGDLALFRADGSYRGNEFRVSPGHWAVCVSGRRLCVDGREYGPDHYAIDLSDAICVANYWRSPTTSSPTPSGSPSRVRVIDLTTDEVTDSLPNVGPHVVRAKGRTVGYGYSGPSWVLLPDGGQLQVNLTPQEGVGLVLEGPLGPWVVTPVVDAADAAAVWLRPVSHTAATAVQLPSGAVRPDACVVGGDRMRVAADQTNGRLTIFEVQFTEPLVALPPPSVVPVVVPAIGRPVFDAWFEFTPPASPLPGNSTVRVAPGELFLRMPNDERVAVYVAGTPDGDVDSLERAIAQAKRHGVPVIGYWTRQAQQGRVPVGADWVGVEGYQAKGDSLSVWEATLRASIARCTRVALICQVYTSNATLTTNLVSLVPVYARLVRDYRQVLAVLKFSGGGRVLNGVDVGWPGHPEVWPAWTTFSAGIPRPALSSPTITIVSYGPRTGPAPLKVRAVQAVTTGAASVVWRWRAVGAQGWNVAATNPSTDIDHTFTFTRPGRYEIGADVYDAIGRRTNRTTSQRIVTVT